MGEADQRLVTVHGDFASALEPRHDSAFALADPDLAFDGEIRPNDFADRGGGQFGPGGLSLCGPSRLTPQSLRTENKCGEEEAAGYGAGELSQREMLCYIPGVSEPTPQPSLAPTPAQEAEKEQAANIFYDVAPRPLTRWQWFLVFLASWVGYALIGLIGRTIRWEVVGQENWESIFRAGKRAIYTFWHRGIFTATWYWRRRGIVVMTSTHFDGEYIARIIHRLGYGAARGSSSRGGLRALAEMARRLKEGHDVGFTIDGPHGPRFVAKPGPVMLARRTGDAIFCFHISPERAYVFRQSWDLLQIPCPFTRAVILMAPPIYVPEQASEEVLREKHAEMQALLDRLREIGARWWSLPETERARLKAALR